MASSDKGLTREGLIPVSGGRVYYRVVGSGDRPPLLAIHGGPGIPHQQLEPLIQLANERPVVFYDQLGCGRSDLPDDPSLWHVDRFVDELEAVKQRLTDGDFHVFGHSWGSMVAADYALRRPSGLASVILASPILSVPRWTEDQARLRKRLPAQAQRALEDTEKGQELPKEECLAALADFRRLFMFRFLDPLPDALQQAQAERNPVVGQLMWSNRPFEVTGNLREYDRSSRLHQVGVPTLLTCGRYDNSTPEATESYRQRIPLGEMAVFEKSSHWPHFEEPEAFLSSLRSFLRRAEG